MTIVNRLMTLLFDVCFAPFLRGPGWLSLIVFSALAAVCGLLVYKYTSDQSAIKRTKDRIKAAILAIKLFRDDLGVIARSLGRVCLCATVMLRHALLPVVLMIVPFVLAMAQLGLRYQWRPLLPGESAVLIVEFAEGGGAFGETSLDPGRSIIVEAGPVRIPSEGRMFWRVSGTSPGRHRILVRVGDEVLGKSITVGGGFARVNQSRSRGSLWDALIHPAEAPLPKDSALSRITISYPDRDSWFCGANLWLVWLMAISFLVAWVFKPVFGVEF